MDGVIVVEVSRQKTHNLYKKSVKRTKKYHVKDNLQALESDTVTFVETKPLSRSVRWQTQAVITRKAKTEKPDPQPAKKVTKIKKTKAKIT